MLQKTQESSVQTAGTIRVRSEERSRRGGAGSYGKRAFDVICSVLLLPLAGILSVAVAITVKFTSEGPVLYWSERVGRNNRIFMMPKFRTMHAGTPEVATHLLREPQVHLTPIGSFLRRTSLDELPQIFCILKGDLSFVGPRPALHNQKDLVALRTKRGIHELTPGLTGWAQINGRDNLPIPEKVDYDCQYLQKQTFFLDLKILSITVRKVIRGDGVTH